MSEPLGKMKFFKNWTIDMKKVPKYSEFGGDFVMDLDYSLLSIISKSSDVVYTDDVKKLLSNIIEKMDRKDTLIVQHESRLGLGRFYPNQSISPICVSRHIKHTLFHYLDWIDLDMIKGHPSIISSVAKKNGFDVPTFDKYLKNPDDIFKMLIQYYSADANNKLSEDNVKDVFNITIYGGTHDTWLKQMESKGKQVKTTPHQFVAEFIKESQAIKEQVYAANHALATRVKGSLTSEYDIKNRVMSYWCGTLENEILHVCYKLLIKCNIIQRRRNVALEFDGLCFKKPASFDKDRSDELVAALNANIQEETGFDVKMKFKEYKLEHVNKNAIDKAFKLTLEVSAKPKSDVVVLEKHYDSDCDENIVSSKARAAINKLNPLFSLFTTGLVADIFKILYEKEFKYVPDGKSGTLYHFNGVYWKPDHDLSFINNFVDKIVVKTLNIYAEKDRKKYSAMLDDEAKKDNAAAYISAMNKFTSEVNKKLRVAKSRSDFITDIKYRLSDDKTEWNKKHYLYCFENCVFDLKTGKRVVPNPDDFINMTCGWEYDVAYDSEKHEKKLASLIATILPDTELLNYYMEILASCLCGIQVQKIFIATGKGGNGKSLLNGLMMHTLGNYGYEVPALLLCEKIKSGPNPEAARLDGKRGVFASEPEANIPFCCAALKPLTGESTLPVRECFSNKVGVSLNLTLVISCNNKPQLDEVNDAVTRRMRGAVVPFKSKFVSQNSLDEITTDNGGVCPPGHFVADEQYLTDDFKKEYKQALFSVLLKKFCDYETKQMNSIPAEVLRLSSDYMAGSDNIYEWFLENYEKAPTEMVLADEVFAVFQSSQKYLQMTKLEKRNYCSILKFKDKLESNLFLGKYYRPKDKYWLGEKIRKPFIESWQRIPETVPELER